MKRVDKIVLSLFIGPLLFTFFVTDFIFLMQFLWKYIDDLVGKGLEFSLILRLIGLFSLTMVPMALPLAILLASTMTLGGLGERSELVAFKSAGISLNRVIGGLMVFIIMLSVGAFVFSNNVLPWSNLKFYSLLYDIRKHKPALDIHEGVFYNGINGYTMKIGSKDADNKTIYDIMVYDHTSGKGNDNLIMADKGEMYMSGDGRFLVMNLYNGKQYKDVKQRSVNDGELLHERVAMQFKDFKKVFDLSEFEMKRTDMNLWSENYHMLTAGQLMRKIDTLRIDINGQSDKIAEYSRSFVAIRGKDRENRVFFDQKDEYEKEIPEEEYKSPEGIKTQELDSLDVDEVLALTLTPEARSKAVDNARNLKNYVNGINTHIKYKEKAVTLNTMMIHKKFTLSIACIILFLIGAPMGAIVRKGGFGFPILIAIIFFLLFHVLNITGEKLVKQMVWPPGRGMWFPIVVLLPIGLLLTYKAARDSKILSADAYIQMLKQLNPRYKRKSN